nr:uncharacterized protein LOC113830076 [Penaeus vannamei]
MAEKWTTIGLIAGNKISGLQKRRRRQNRRRKRNETQPNWQDHPARTRERAPLPPRKRAPLPPRERAPLHPLSGKLLPGVTLMPQDTAVADAPSVATRDCYDLQSSSSLDSSCRVIVASPRPGIVHSDLALRS